MHHTQQHERVAADARAGARGQWASLALALLLLAVSACSGCSRTERASPVDPAKAREALTTALDGWKQGDAPSSLKDRSPSITVQDLDWLTGAKLIRYELTGDGKEVEANLYVPVKLTLRTPQGKEVRKNVSYVVGTSPRLTVFRDFH